MVSACGVICSSCPAYEGSQKGLEYQARVVEAWHRIYGLQETPDHITCGGCLGSDEELFYTSRNCAARRCCKSRGYASCAECPVDHCANLEKAQAVWDEVPEICKHLSAEEFETYAQPYCAHRKRIDLLRYAIRQE